MVVFYIIDHQAPGSPGDQKWICDIEIHTAHLKERLLLSTTHEMRVNHALRGLAHTLVRLTGL
jgi:hypothetical protein